MCTSRDIHRTLTIPEKERPWPSLCKETTEKTMIENTTEKLRDPHMTNQSTEKALTILEFLASSREPARLRDISDALGLNSSTTLRFLSTLQICGYVAQDEQTQRYYPTYKICWIANQIISRIELQTVTHPFLARLSEQFQEALCVSVEQGMQMVYIDVASNPDRTLLSTQRIGNNSPMHCTGNGKLLLLNYTEEQIEAYIRYKGLPARTPYTITTKERLLEELAATRAADISYDNEECEIGVRCMSCPIRDYTNTIVAGISVTGPVSRMTDEMLERFRAPLSEAARKISQSLGWR